MKKTYYFLIPGLCTLILAGILYWGMSQQSSETVVEISEVPAIEFVRGHDEVIYEESLGMYVSPLDEQRGYRTTMISLGDRHYHLDIADTIPLRKQGLSYRYALCAECGMLFIFETTATHGFWMKDMNFPIDIIWLDEAKQIVHIERSVEPDSYQTKPPTIFSPDQPARYVVELPAGSI